MDTRFHRLLAIVTLLSSFSLQAETEEVYFPELREKIAKVKPLSPEDYALAPALLQEFRLLAATKKPALPIGRPFVMTESVPRSGEMWFTDHLYMDRQLFAARDIWEPGKHKQKIKSHAKTFELIRQSGYDAISVFTIGNALIHQSAQAIGLPPGNPWIVSTMTPSGRNGKNNPEAMKIIAASPHSFRIDGKILVMNWTDLPVEKTKAFIQEVEQQTGCPIAYIESLGTVPDREDPFVFFTRNNGQIPASTLLLWFDRITEYLECCAGVEFSNRLPLADGRLNVEYYDQIVYPLFAAACAQERFNGKKLFAAYAMAGYNNYRSKMSLSRDCTKTFRHWMELCRKHKADLIKMFEWDEYREDTHLQPTVNHPMALMRLMRYYTEQFKGNKPSPLPGDDLSLPNLLVTHSKQAPAGPDFEIELLNIPDTDQAEEYFVKLELLDSLEQCLHATPKLSFNRAELTEHTIRLPSGMFVASDILAPRLTIWYGGRVQVIQEGLPFATVRPTAIGERTWLSTPLRNLIPVRKAKVSFGSPAIPAGGCTEFLHLPVTADLEFTEPLNSVEIIQDRCTVFSHDPQNEFRQHDSEWQNLLFHLTYLNNPGGLRVKADLALDNAPSAVYYTQAIDPGNRHLPNPTVKSLEQLLTDKPHIDFGRVGNEHINKMFAVRKSELPQAIFKVQGQRCSGQNQGQSFQWELPLERLKKTGLQSIVFPDGLQLVLEYPTRMERLPLPINDTKAKFQDVLRPVNPYGAFAVRAVSRTGKVWWSKPFCLRPPISGAQTEISVQDLADCTPYSLQLPANLVPHINYRFDPSFAGNILTTDWGREFYANAGAYDSIPTAYEAYHCAVYSAPTPFIQNRQPNGDNPTAPLWEKLSDGNWCLVFSGRGEFIVFPPSALPIYAGYAIRFDFNPEDLNREQVYFTHCGDRQYGFLLKVVNGHLELEFHRRFAKEQPWTSLKSISTTLTPAENQWNQLELQYNLTTVALTLNGKTEAFPCTGLPRQLALGGFGGDGSKSASGQPRYFKGRLKSFEIRHAVPSSLQ